MKTKTFFERSTSKTRVYNYVNAYILNAFFVCSIFFLSLFFPLLILKKKHGGVQGGEAVCWMKCF